MSDSVDYFGEEETPQTSETLGWFLETLKQTGAIAGSVFLLRAADKLANAGLKKVDQLIALTFDDDVNMPSKHKYNVGTTDKKPSLEGYVDVPLFDSVRY